MDVRSIEQFSLLGLAACSASLTYPYFEMAQAAGCYCRLTDLLNAIGLAHGSIRGM